MKLLESESVRSQILRLVASVGIPREAVNDVSSVDVVEQFDLRTDTTKRVAYIRLFAPNTAAALQLNGRRNLYNGPTQKWLQQLIAGSLRSSGIDAVRLQVMPSVGEDPVDCGLREEKLIDSLDLQSAVALGFIPGEGIVARTCRSFGIDKVLMRSGLVIGPNPDLARVLANVLSVVDPELPIYDPFAGTLLSSAVCARAAPPRKAIAYDRQTGKANSFDAFDYVHSEKFGVIVVDPLFEDVICYLRNVASRLSWQYIVVCSGYVCDLDWNHWVERELEAIGTRRVSLESRAQNFGANVFVFSNA